MSPRYALHVMPILSRSAVVHSKRLAALVLIVDPASRVQTGPALVAAAPELSPSEAELTVMIAQGPTLGQIAANTVAHTAPSRRTSKTHLPSSEPRDKSRQRRLSRGRTSH